MFFPDIMWPMVRPAEAKHTSKINKKFNEDINKKLLEIHYLQQISALYFQYLHMF